MHIIRGFPRLKPKNPEKPPFICISEQLSLGKQQKICICSLLVELFTLITNLISMFVPAIEKFWFAAKNYFNKRLLAATSEISRDRFRALVLESVNSVAQAKVLRLCEANREYVSRVLRSQTQQNQANEHQ